jgi:hypothetical protein
VAGDDLGALQAHGAVVALHAGDRGSQRQLGTLRSDLVGERASHGSEVDDPGVGRVQARDPRAVRLELGDLLGAQPPQARHAVGRAAALELVEALELSFMQRDDHLAAALDIDAAFLAVGVQAGCALDAHPRLQRAGLVVDARVDDAGVVARLPGPDLAGGVDDRHAQAGLAREQIPCGRQAQDPGADDGEVVALHDRPG